MASTKLGSLLCLALLFVLAGALPACTSAPNTQFVPVGQRCANNDDCGTSPFVCALDSYPGGYCEKPCRTDGECPLDSICYVDHCRRKCANDDTCRKAEGYVCRPTGASAPFCDLPIATNP